MLENVRLALRSHARRPGFALTALLLIALGIGATTTIFSVVDGVVFRPLAYPNADRLVVFTNPSHSIPTFRAWQSRTTSYAAMSAVFGRRDLDLTGSGAPTQLRGALVDSAFFSLFGARAALGRLFVPGEFVGPPQAAVLTWGLWQRRFGGDPTVIGRAITLNGQPTVVVGILDRSFELPEAMMRRDTEVLLPFDLATPEFQGADWHILRVAARLRGGVSRPEANAELTVLAASLARERPDQYREENGRPVAMAIEPIHQAMVSEVDGTLYMLLGAVGLLLLIAVANVANLFLARGTERVREMAVRSALGADGRALLGSVLTESTLIALAGGVLGVGLAFLGVGAFRALNPGDVPMIERVAVNPRVLVFALAVSVAAGILFGMAPAWQAARVDVGEVLKDGSGGGTGGRERGRLRRALVVAEVAIAMVLLAGAGLLFNSFVRLRSVDPGFQPDRLGVVPLTLGESRYDPAARAAFAAKLLERARGTPGVESATIAVGYPLQFYGGSRCCWASDRWRTDGGEEKKVLAYLHPVAGNYFGTIGARLEGRDLTAADATIQPVPAVVSAGFARETFAGVPALGRTFSSRNTEYQIVGIVSGLHHFGLDSRDESAIYVPYASQGARMPFLSLIVRTAGRPAAILPGLRQSVWDLEPDLPVGDVFPLTDRIVTSTATPRFYTVLLMVFAAVALALAAGGIYASMLYRVRQRRRELGIRVALGAGRARVLGAVVGEGGALAGLGIGLGVAGGLLLSRTLRALVFGVGTTDPATFATGATFLGAVALAACYGPARRAAETDPLEVIRSE